MHQHKLINQSGDDGSGFSRWKGCTVCGATKHGGYWWLGGYKSKTPPPCHSEPYGKQDVREWKNQAQDVFDKD